MRSIRCLLGVLACALLASCAHVYDDGFAGDGGNVRDQDSQVEEGASSEAMPRDQGTGDGTPRERDAGRPSGDGDGDGDAPRVVDGPGQPGAAMDAGPAPVLDAAVIQLFEPITVESEVSSEYATPNDDIAILWRTFDDPTQQYFAQRMTIEGDLDFFRVVLPDEPPVAGRYQPEDAETGLELPDAPWIAAGSIYRVVGGKLESNPSGVDSLDIDIVIGATRGVIVWTPVELAPGWHLETKGIARSSDEPLAAGWHLFVEAEEVDLGTLLTLGNEIW
jgi:hypothetical protein